MLWRAVARRFPVLGIRDFKLLLVDRLIAPASYGFSLVGVSFAVLDEPSPRRACPTCSPLRSRRLLSSC